MPRLLLLCLALALAVPASAQTSSELVTWRVRADRAAPGAQARVVIDAAVADGWRLYALGSEVGIPLTVALDVLPAGVTAGPLRQSGVRRAYDEAFEAHYPYFAGAGRVVQWLRLARGTPAGTHEVSGTVRFAVCDDRICLPPARSTFRVPLVVE